MPSHAKSPPGPCGLASRPSRRPRKIRSITAWLAAATTVVAGLALSSPAVAQPPVRLITPPALGPTAQPAAAAPSVPVKISADFGHELPDRQAGGRSRLVVLRGHVRITQGTTQVTAGQAIAWIHRPEIAMATASFLAARVTLYLEDNVRVTRPGQTRSQPVLLLDLEPTNSQVELAIRRRTMRPGPVEQDPLYRRGLARRQQRPDVHLAAVAFQQGTPPQATVSEPTGLLRRLQLFPRAGVPFHIKTGDSPGTTPVEKVIVITGGVNIVIDFVVPSRTEALFGSGTVDLSADRVVIWTQLGDEQQLTSQLEQSVRTPMQMYLEGNIEIRQGGRPGEGEHVLRASRAVYDARERRALLLDADLRTRLPGARVPLRVRAERIRQNGASSFHAQNAWATISPFGKPGYRIQASDVFLDRRPLPGWLGGGNSYGRPKEVDWITSQNNLLLVGEVPIFFVPNLGGPAAELNLPLRRINIQHDNTFGGQVETTWSLFSLLGLEPPGGVDWTLSADYYSLRGPRLATGTAYQRQGLLGLPGEVRGWGEGVFLRDDGVDNLGRDRRRLEPKAAERGRTRLVHRHELPGGLTMTGEIGYLSDRNLLEQYYEQEFDEEKDHETLLYFEQTSDATAWSLLARPQLNTFETVTEWLPRGDLYIFSQPLLGGWLSWSSHTSAGYGRLRPAEAPSDPDDVFSPLSYATEAGGAVLMSRHELSLPFAVGPAPLVPYLMAESAYWSEGFDGSEVDRQLFSGGIRGSLSAWRIFPDVHSPILGLEGLAHKMTFEADLAWTESTRGLDEIPQYNEIDDNAQQRFRYRLLDNSFGGVLPLGFDPRSVVVRQGTGLGMTAAWHELVADQQALRMAWRQRLQTKVGPPGMRRIRNWMTLDLEATWFPRAERDNFGEDFGILRGTYRWHLSDRTMLLADAYLDLFEDAPRLWNVGLLSQRTARGTLYAGLRQIRGGGLDSQILTGSLSYRMSPKWVSTIGAAYDLAEQRNQGQSLTLTRIGGDFLVHIGGSYDESRHSTGFHISLQPRFGGMDGGNPQLGALLGLR